MSKKGFTLIELLVVIAIIGLLSSIVLASLNSARAKARDARRKEDLLEIQKALELYYDDHGSYPLAYGGGWGGVNAYPCGTNGDTSGPNAYIVGLTPTYMGALPTDPGTSASDSCKGYLYISNGVDYKLLIYTTWEEGYPAAGQPWYEPLRPTSALMLCNKDQASCLPW